MSTLALQLGQLFMFQKLEQTMVNLIFVLMDLSYGTKLMRDLRFYLLIHSKVNYQCISLICISFTIFWRFCYLVVYLVYFFYCIHV